MEEDELWVATSHLPCIDVQVGAGCSRTVRLIISTSAGVRRAWSV